MNFFIKQKKQIHRENKLTVIKGETGGRVRDKSEIGD